GGDGGLRDEIPGEGWLVVVVECGWLESTGCRVSDCTKCSGRRRRGGQQARHRAIDASPGRGRDFPTPAGSPAAFGVCGSRTVSTERAIETGPAPPTCSDTDGSLSAWRGVVRGEAFALVEGGERA